MDGPTSIAGLESLIAGVSDAQKEMAAKLSRLETTLATLASKQEVADTIDSNRDKLEALSRTVERLDLLAKERAHLGDDMQTLVKDINDRMSGLEQRLSGTVSEIKLGMAGRLSTVETELRSRVSVVELRKLASEIKDRAHADEVRAVQEHVNKVRDEASERIDDVCERNFSMRQQLDDKMGQMQAAAASLQESVDARALRLEQQASQARDPAATAA